MTNPSFRYPTPEELIALEREARRARAVEAARLAKAGIAGIRALFNRTEGVRIKGPRHA
jgi:hypothetical protein